jgi:hypothetical protein
MTTKKARLADHGLAGSIADLPICTRCMATTSRVSDGVQRFRPERTFSPLTRILKFSLFENGPQNPAFTPTSRRDANLV